MLPTACRSIKRTHTSDFYSWVRGSADASATRRAGSVRRPSAEGPRYARTSGGAVMTLSARAAGRELPGRPGVRTATTGQPCDEQPRAGVPKRPACRAWRSTREAGRTGSGKTTPSSPFGLCKTSRHVHKSNRPHIVRAARRKLAATRKTTTQGGRQPGRIQKDASPLLTLSSKSLPGRAGPLGSRCTTNRPSPSVLQLNPDNVPGR